MIDLSHQSLIDGKSFNQIYQLSAEQISSHVDNIVNLFDKIADKYSDKLILVTGSNGSGKSVLRKQLGLALKNKNIKASSVSMEKRTTQNPDFGALSGALNDTAWSATSDNSLHLINSLFKSCNGNFLIVDEPEIGMSTAMTKAIAAKLVDFYNESSMGMMVISHNKYIVSRLLEQSDVVFVNLNGFSADDYLKSFDIDEEPFDLIAFANCRLLFEEIHKRSQPVKS